VSEIECETFFPNPPSATPVFANAGDGHSNGIVPPSCAMSFSRHTSIKRGDDVANEG
jgi:hypothetical protein